MIAWIILVLFPCYTRYWWIALTGTPTNRQSDSDVYMFFTTSLLFRLHQTTFIDNHECLPLLSWCVTCILRCRQITSLKLPSKSGIQKGSWKIPIAFKDRIALDTDTGKGGLPWVLGDIYSQFPLRLSLQRIASSNYTRARRRPNMIPRRSLLICDGGWRCCRCCPWLIDC